MAFSGFKTAMHGERSKRGQKPLIESPNFSVFVHYVEDLTRKVFWWGTRRWTFAQCLDDRSWNHNIQEGLGYVKDLSGLNLCLPVAGVQASVVNIHWMGDGHYVQTWHGWHPQTENSNVNYGLPWESVIFIACDRSSPNIHSGVSETA